MNAQHHDGGFVDLVDFKWLMAGLGWWVDLSRLQRDKAYADECVARGIASGSQLVRQRSAELLSRLVHADAQQPALAH
jgi:hypothetical protein